MNVQVACDLDGRLAWISDPIEGRRHDTAALQISGVLDTLDAGNWMGDKGYIGNDMITPIRKPAHRDFLDWEKQFNTAINKIRYLIERTIANLKTWRILHTDYRRPLATFTTTISAAVGLHFYAGQLNNPPGTCVKCFCLCLIVCGAGDSVLGVTPDRDP